MHGSAHVSGPFTYWWKRRPKDLAPGHSRKTRASPSRERTQHRAWPPRARTPFLGHALYRTSEYLADQLRPDGTVGTDLARVDVRRSPAAMDGDLASAAASPNAAGPRPRPGGPSPSSDQGEKKRSRSRVQESGLTCVSATVRTAGRFSAPHSDRTARYGFPLPATWCRNGCNQPRPPEPAAASPPTPRHFGADEHRTSCHRGERGG